MNDKVATSGTAGLLVRLLAPYLLALVAVTASLYAYGDRVVESLYLDTLAENVLQEARLAGQLLPWGVRGSAMDRECAAVGTPAGARITIIAPDGTVLGDSAAASNTLENHAHQPEVEAAWRAGDGRSVRVSPTVNRALFYRAWRQTRPEHPEEQRIVRLAVPIAAVEDVRHGIRVAVWGGVVVAALAALWPALMLSRRLSRRVVHLTEYSTAVAEGKRPPALVPAGGDIVAQLEANVTAMARSLGAQLAAAREERGKLEAVLRSMLEGVVLIDIDGTIQLANRCAEQLFGVRPGESLHGMPLIAVSRDPDLRELVHNVMAGHGEPPLRREATLQGMHLQVTATPIDDPVGGARRYILVFHDITALKKLETTRRDFVANVSHELRTPLTAIRGYAETLQAGAINDPDLARKFVSVIERHSERLSRLTEDLLTLSDLELGRTELEPIALPLLASVEEAVDVVRDRAAQAQIGLRRDVPADLPLVSADPDRIAQVFVNLLDNAVKYTPAGGQITVSARVATNGALPVSLGSHAAESFVELCVADTGIGIPAEDLPRLTERFYRVDKARSRELGGTGLGLAIVKHIVQAHGGALRIDSQLGRGTSVYVYLPIADSAGAQ
jgi:two-component system, OmpR family, phosphate regulon sensor histidine kinase PhoR